MRALVRRAIAEAGFVDASIVEAATVAEALEIVTTRDLDLVCCDIHLSDGTGFDVLRGVHEAGCGVMFGFVTSDCLPETRVRAANEGAAFLINKPFTPETIAPVLSAAAERAAAPVGSGVECRPHPRA
jgi:two-component system chemotaxis response regulator CheY